MVFNGRLNHCWWDMTLFHSNQTVNIFKKNSATPKKSFATFIILLCNVGKKTFECIKLT